MSGHTKLPVNLFRLKMTDFSEALMAPAAPLGRLPRSPTPEALRFTRFGIVQMQSGRDPFIDGLQCVLFVNRSNRFRFDVDGKEIHKIKRSGYHSGIRKACVRVGR